MSPTRCTLHSQFSTYLFYSHIYSPHIFCNFYVGVKYLWSIKSGKWRFYTISLSIWSIKVLWAVNLVNRVPRFKGLYTLSLEKKGHFYDFFLKKQHNFIQKTERLFIFTCHKVFYEFFQKKIFITRVTIAIVPKHNFPDISRGEHDKEGTAYPKYTEQKKL